MSLQRVAELGCGRFLLACLQVHARAVVNTVRRLRVR